MKATSGAAVASRRVWNIVGKSEVVGPKWGHICHWASADDGTWGFGLSFLQQRSGGLRFIQKETRKIRKSLAALVPTAQPGASPTPFPGLAVPDHRVPRQCACPNTRHRIRIPPGWRY
ncbi:hypothetical protein NDU88_002362 [Pleurodeles waltl]|uniref:Uncharacterized protein n=1 Tax=Pleurodeles waltl TaxID=8319 RepID=A0AAV7U9K0_PLEWA|nr:hypothetical protein NDU88_002362 [Pleurodeles waltl]